MKYNGVILKKFAVMDDEIARLKGLGEVTTARLNSDHFLKHGVRILSHHLDDLTAFRNEVTGSPQ